MGSFSITIRSLICALVMILLNYLSTRIFIRNRIDDYEFVIYSIVYAVIFTLSMSIFSILVHNGIKTNDGDMIFVKQIGIWSVIINSFITAIVGVFFGITRYSKSEFIKYSIRISFASIIVGIIISSIIGSIIIFTFVKKYTDNLGIESFNLDYFKYIFNSSYLGIFILIHTFILLGSWLFILANFVSINILGILSFNIFNIADKTSIMILLLILIPISIFLLVGRKIKVICGKNYIKAIGIFSSVYTMFMVGITYFTRVIFSFNLYQLEKILNEFIGDLQEFLCFIGMEAYSENMYHYLDQIYERVSSGLYIGPGIWSIIIITFIFSSIFIYIGSISKKLEEK